MNDPYGRPWEDDDLLTRPEREYNALLEKQAKARRETVAALLSLYTSLKTLVSELETVISRIQEEV